MWQGVVASVTGLHKQREMVPPENGGTHDVSGWKWSVVGRRPIQHPSHLAAAVAMTGGNWILIGLARLHLSLPSAAGDPGAEADLLRQHKLAMLEERVAPERDAGDVFASLPGEARRVWTVSLSWVGGWVGSREKGKGGGRRRRPGSHELKAR